MTREPAPTTTCTGGDGRMQIIGEPLQMNQRVAKRRVGRGVDRLLPPWGLHEAI